MKSPSLPAVDAIHNYDGFGVHSVPAPAPAFKLLGCRVRRPRWSLTDLPAAFAELGIPNHVPPL